MSLVRVIQRLYVIPAWAVAGLVDTADTFVWLGRRGRGPRSGVELRLREPAAVSQKPPQPRDLDAVVSTCATRLVRYAVGVCHIQQAICRVTLR